MEARPLLLVGAVLWIAAASMAGRTQAADEPETQYWRKSTFALPFQEPQSGRDVPKEVHLHVSSDRGQTWKLYAQSPPGKKRFEFKAPQDGEYWFMLRTKFTSGEYLPAGRPAAEIKVVVDTAPPTLAVAVREGEGGEVHIQWQVSDANLAAETLRIEYKTTDLASDWQRVAIERAVSKPGQTEYSGETTIVPLIDGGEHSLIVRADVADKAHNHTAREQPLRLSKHASAPAAETPDDAPPEMQPTFPQRGPATADSNDDHSYPVLDSSQDPFLRAVPRGNALGDPASGKATPAGRTRPGDADSPPRDGPAMTSPDQHPLVSETAHPPVTQRRDAPPQADDMAAPSTVEIQPHRINKKRFELVYDIDSVGSAGIAEVELWCTRDGGNTWNPLGADDDCRSPMLVSVEGEGLYGFRVVAATTNGLRSHEPVSGEPPDVWVEVDLTPPGVRLIAAEQGTGDEADKLVITWEAKDERLAARPVSLAYRERPDGPTTTIASGLPNTGRYAWRLDHRLPEQVYLQIEVRDEAGNSGVGELPDAVLLRQVRPQSHIREVHPVGVLPRTPRRLPR